jgi:ribosomal protein L44E
MGYQLDKFSQSKQDKRRCDRFWDAIFSNPRSPRFNRSRPTKRQQAVTRRRCHDCLCPRSLQIGGGQCGCCGKFKTDEVKL